MSKDFHTILPFYTLLEVFETPSATPPYNVGMYAEAQGMWNYMVRGQSFTCLHCFALRGRIGIYLRIN